MAALEERIRGVVARQLGVDVSEVLPDASLQEDLGADSLELVELLMALEDEFDIEVPEEIAETITTIADVERYIVEHVT
ncbi:MAG: acyl carrier protein [Myxococcales bacterium]|nr:MAG: acyl carrier protein [Myxococcales bacterium]